VREKLLFLLAKNCADESLQRLPSVAVAAH